MQFILRDYLGSTLSVGTLALRIQALVQPYEEMNTERYKSMSEAEKDFNALRYAFQRCVKGGLCNSYLK